MINKDFQNGFALGVASGGVVEVEVEVPKPEQEKTVNITENGTTEVLPDENKVLSKVTVNVDVAGGGAELDALEDLIDNSGVLDSTEGSLSEKIERLINIVKNNENPSEPPEPDISENYLKSSEGYVLKTNDEMYLTLKESE